MLLPLIQALAPVASSQLPAATFAPGSVTSATLLAWYRGDAGTFQDSARTVPAVANGNPVLGVTDQSGHGHHATNSANGFTLAVPGVNGLNALDAFSTGSVGTSLSTGLTLTPPYTIIVVAQELTSPTSSQLVGGSNCILDFARTGGQRFGIGGVDVSSPYTPSLSVTHVVAGRVGTSGSTYRVDGIDRTLSVGVTGNWPSLVLGQPVARAMSALICEVLIYSGVVSDSELSTLTNEYLNRWGVFTYLTGDVMTGVIDATQSPYFGNLQAAVNAAASGQTVWLANNVFTQTQPLLIQTSGVRVVGAGNRQSGAQINASNYYGPVVMLSALGYGPTLGTSLLSGAGNALVLASGSSTEGFYQLRDINSCNFDGLSQFCIELAFQPSNISANGGIIQSVGQPTSAIAKTLGLNLGQNAGGQLTGSATTGGVKSTINSAGGFLANGTAVFIALDYDGTTLRLFAGPPGGTCALLASTAATGTVAQQAWEDFTVGGQINNFPESGYAFFPAAGSYDSIRFSKVSRHTSAFTAPTAKLTTDANTLFLCNFDNFLADGGSPSTSGGPLTRVSVGASGTGWIPFRQPNRGGTAAIRLENFSINGGSNSSIGLLSHLVEEAQFRDLYISGCTCGVFLAGQGFLTDLSSVKIVAPNQTAPSGQSIARFGFCMTNSSGGGTYANLSVTGFQFNVLGFGGGNFIRPYLVPEGATLSNMLIRGGGSAADVTHVDYLEVDDEPGTPALNLMASLWFDGMASVVFTAGLVQVVSTTATLAGSILINGGHNHQFNGTSFWLASNITNCVHETSAPSTAPVNNDCYILLGQPFLG